MSIVSDVVKVEGEDPNTPGFLREVRVRWCVSDFGASVNRGYVLPWLAREDSEIPGPYIDSPILV